MRRYIKKQLFELQVTLLRFFSAIQTSLQRRQYEQAYELLVEFQQALIEIGNTIEKEEGVETEAVKDLESICELLYKIAANIKTKAVDTRILQVRKLLSSYYNHLKYDIQNSKLKVVFFPYKGSMWTSFESIWKAAVQDEDCDVSVVPIPYCDFGSGNHTVKWNYEIDKYPSYVPVISYSEYSLKDEKPDVAFIHNPYDDTNTLTSVPPEYYSENIKKYVDCLVYSPYFTMGAFTRGKTDALIFTKGGMYADKIIVQSEFVKKIYESYGYDSQKLLDYGSPKADAVIAMGREQKIPDEWKKKLAGKKKIILLNTHWSYFMRGKAYEEQGKSDFAVRYHKEFMKAIEERKEDCGLIWRPHPLMLTAMERRMPEKMEYVRELMELIQESDYGVIDDTGNYMNAFACSHALVSTYSTLINEYLITGKPVMIFQTKPTDEGGERSPIDYRKCYFRFSKAGNMSFETFLDMVLKGEDPKHEERMKMLKNKSFNNMDGTAGEKIYQYLRQLYF